MKKFENPMIELHAFAVEDVVTTSGDGLGENETGTIPGGFQSGTPTAVAADNLFNP